MLDLQTILQTLITSGTPVVIIAAGLPGATGMVPVMAPGDPAQVEESVQVSVPADTSTPSEPDAAEPRVAPRSTRGVAAATAPHLAGPRAASARMTAGSTPLDRLRHDEQRNGQQSRPPEEWAQLLGMSGRELRRAVKANALKYDIEPFGRGHGARLISTSALRGYLETVDAVERGGTSAPEWYARVRRRT